MFQIQKIRAHITMLEQRRTKIQAYLEEIRRILPEQTLHQSMQDRRRLQDIEASISRLDNQISQYQQKLQKFEELGGEL